MNDQHFETAKKVIDNAFSNPLGKSLFKDDSVTNIINSMGKKMNYEQLSSDDPELYNAIANYIQTKKQPQMNNLHEVSKKVLKETSFELPVSKNILRYDDDIVLKTIKDVVAKDFKNITLQTITGQEGGAFYNMTLSLELEEDIKDDLERKRFYISQVMSKFKSQFFGTISAILPVVNITTSAYQFTKNSNILKFSCTLCLSHTNDRDWVSGVYRGTGDKKKDFKTESAASKKHAITAIPLNTAVNAYKNGKLDKKMLDTAIKACGRNELEFYVLRSVGISADVDISDVNAESTAASDKEE